MIKNNQTKPKIKLEITQSDRYGKWLNFYVNNELRGSKRIDEEGLNHGSSIEFELWDKDLIKEDQNGPEK